MNKEEAAKKLEELMRQYDEDDCCNDLVLIHLDDVLEDLWLSAYAEGIKLGEIRRGTEEE